MEVTLTSVAGRSLSKHGSSLGWEDFKIIQALSSSEEKYTEDSVLARVPREGDVALASFVFETKPEILLCPLHGSL